MKFFDKVKYAWHDRMAALEMGKQIQVDRINAKLQAKGEKAEVYIDENGKLRKRRLEE